LTTHVQPVLEIAGEHVGRMLLRTETLLEEIASGYGAALGRHASATLAAGGKRLRPVLVFVCAGTQESMDLVRAGAAVELLHMATLVHDDVLDRAPMRRGRPTVFWASGRDAATATGDFLFSRAFAQLAATDSAAAVRALSNASSSLARGELMQRDDAFGDVSEARYFERCTLKTGKLFEAACRLADGSGAFGLALGIAFQITDDILDCAGVTFETGKISGTDLREGTPTLPLLLAAARDDGVREALAGGPLVDGVLLRIASTGALEESRRVALAYAGNARACLNGELHREELESLTDAIVDRDH
jgi:octaprenyl-diphosphate synthase